MFLFYYHDYFLIYQNLYDVRSEILVYMFQFLPRMYTLVSVPAHPIIAISETPSLFSMDSGR